MKNFNIKSFINSHIVGFHASEKCFIQLKNYKNVKKYLHQSKLVLRSNISRNRIAGIDTEDSSKSQCFFTCFSS